MVENGKMNRDDFIILWTSDLIPPSPLVVRNDIDPNLVRKFTEAMLHAPPNIIAAEGQIEGYKPVSDKDYDVVREVMKKVKIHGDQ
jgi:phosphonate transport system substrate-binding protein